MIKIENVEIVGWEPAIRGMRNPKNSWKYSDSYKTHIEDADTLETADYEFFIGECDHNLMEYLAVGGSVHAKYRRMITVYMDITAPLYWWKEFDTYKVGTVANSCSTMHKIHSKPIELSDFSMDDFYIDEEGIGLKDCFINVVYDCEMLRKKFIETSEKKYWRGLIQLLPSSYNQKRTVMLNYEVLAGMYEHRKNHKLDEWRIFCEWIEGLPYSELIIGGLNHGGQ